MRAANECLDEAEKALTRGDRVKASAYLDLADLHLKKVERDEILSSNS